MKSSRLAQCHPRWQTRLRVWLFVLSVSLAASSAAVDVTVELKDSAGATLSDAIVALYARNPPTSTSAPSAQHQMDQVDKQFAPRLLAIQVGDQIVFPNSDNIRHHVYSFSPAHKFELPLYRGIPSEPVRFEVAGEVVLGCNIHDRMSAHIYVLDTPLFALTTAGRHTFTGIAPGEYEVAVFHPLQSDAQDGARQPLQVATAASQQVALTVALQNAPAADDSGLSPLEQKFQALRRGAR